MQFERGGHAFVEPGAGFAGWCLDSSSAFAVGRRVLRDFFLAA